MAITYQTMVLGISVAWLLVRLFCWAKQGRVRWQREALLMLVYICLIVVARFTFFPFSRVNGQIRPLVFDAAAVFPPRINLIPFVYLFDYPQKREAWLNLIGNTAMFVPLGVIWPLCFRGLDSHGKVVAAGIGVSLCIELLQLPFFDRVTDIDDLILNSLGFILGYGLYLLGKKIRQMAKRRR